MQFLQTNRCPELVHRLVAAGVEEKREDLQGVAAKEGADNQEVIGGAVERVGWGEDAEGAEGVGRGWRQGRSGRLSIDTANQCKQCKLLIACCHNQSGLLNWKPMNKHS